MKSQVRILYLEDDPLDVKLVRETLKSESLVFELTPVDTRLDFIRSLEAGIFDLVLADYRVPGFGGKEALTLLRERWPDLPFIFVTGALGEEEAISLLKQGATDYVLKGHLSRLTPALRRALDEAEEQRRRQDADRDVRESNLRLTQVLESVTQVMERLFENKHVLVAHLDEHFNFLRISQAYAQANQQEREYFTGKNYFALFPNTETEAVFRQVQETGKPYFAVAKPLPALGSQPGRESFWDWSLQPVKNERGQVEGLLLFLLDVTRRKQTQRARVASERRYRVLVENVDSIIMRWKWNGAITFANRFAHDFFGYAPGTLVRLNAAGTLFPATGDGDRRGPFFRDLSTDPRQHQTAECENVRRDGTRVWIHWTYRPVRDAAGTVMELLCVGSDITDRRRKELEMEQMQQRLRSFARTMGTTLHGRAVSPGLAEGVALLYLPPGSEAANGLQTIAEGDVDSELKRFDQALTASIGELEKMREEVMARWAEEETAVVDVHLAMLHDASFIEKCRRRVREDLTRVEHAVAAEVNDLEKMLQGLEQEFMRERSADVRDIGRRILWNLRASGESPVEGLKSLPPGTILVTEQLLPSDTLQLDRKNVVAFVTERNSPASHVAILARAMGIPAVCDVRKATSLLASGDRLLVDAETETVTIAPTRTQSASFAERREQYATLAAVAGQGPTHDCVTKDGVGIGLHANIGRPDEVHLVVECHLDGVGLFRSEFLFLDVDQPPDLEAQVAAYSSVAKTLQPRPVVIRTMDLGGDKIPRFLRTGEDLKHRSDRRGLAFSLAEKTLFQTQLRAILRAASSGNVCIMFPMVLGVADLREACRRVDEAMESVHGQKRPALGAMIETPASVFEIHEILEIVDFVSIGTNDLAHFTLAIDRESSEFPGVLSFLHPGVLKATEQVTRAAGEQGVDLSVCGEAAGDPVTACLLVGMGVRKLSMSPFLGARVRAILQQVTIPQVEAIAKEALAATTPKEVQRVVEEAFHDVLSSLH